MPRIGERTPVLELVTFGDPMPMIPESTHRIEAAWAYDVTYDKEAVLMSFVVMAVRESGGIGQWFRLCDFPYTGRFRGRSLRVNRAQVAAIAPAKVEVMLERWPRL